MTVPESHSVTEDRLLISRYLAGDHQAFDSLYLRHAGDVLGFRGVPRHDNMDLDWPTGADRTKMQTSDSFPLQDRIENVGDADSKEVYDTERHLLDVASTRARDHLVASGVAPASEFLHDMGICFPVRGGAPYGVPKGLVCLGCVPRRIQC